MKYRVVGFTAGTVSAFGPSFHHRAASEMKETYGLPHSIDEIIRLWEEYSDSMAAGWMLHCPEDVEHVFNVKLEPIEDEE